MPFFLAHQKLEPLNPTQHYTTLVTKSSSACLWSFWQSLACFISKWSNTFPPEISLLTLNQENQLSTKLVLVSSINDRTSKEILTIKNDAVYNWQLSPFFTSLSQSRACWSKNGEHGNSEGLDSSESNSEKTGTITPSHLKVLFFLLSLAISKFLLFSISFALKTTAFDIS